MGYSNAIGFSFFFALVAFAESPALQTVLGKCVACHSTKLEVPLGLRKEKGLLWVLPQVSDGVLEDMSARAKLNLDERQTLVESVNRLRSSEGDQASPTCFLPGVDQKRKLNRLPSLSADSSGLARWVFANKHRILFYDKVSVPRTWFGDLPTQHLSPAAPINATQYRDKGYHANAGMEFPWLHPAGVDCSQNASSDKFVVPSPGGTILKMVVRTKSSHPKYFGTEENVRGPLPSWDFSPGTTFGEVLKVDGLPFEIRLRSRQEDGTWKMDVLKPFESTEELVEGLRALCARASHPVGCQSIPAIIDRLQSPKSVFVPKLTDYLNTAALGTKRDPLTLSSTALTALSAEATLQDLPSFPQDVRQALLTETPFKSVFGKPWTKANPPGWAPTSSSEGSLVPKAYFAGFLPMTETACMKCHETAGRHVNNFDPSAKQMFDPIAEDTPRPRSWYFFVQGADGILSFHPFEPRAIRERRAAGRENVRECLVQSGLVIE
ncbi:MAG: hypothetical protein HYZ71_12215 [Deltaproteobacteria bacterium]|nr:hypothetical protein [Deltaproteobacteria bacterium]